MKKLFASILLTLLATGAWANPVVEMQTSAGKILIELYPEQSPKTVENFLQYVKDDFYRGTVFHRVINGFMIQGGGFNAKMEQKTPRDPIDNEASNGLKNERGTIAMARTNDPNSATAQFFINHADNRLLDYPKPDGYGYAVFGKVTHGMDVVDRIAKVATGNHPAGHRNVPLAPVIIQSVKLQKDK
jgi:cyclophilin family peptidyl-prolyl cis-trans isomerase